MQFDPILIEDFLEVLDSKTLSSIQLNQNPYFLLLSANHLKQNSHLLVKSGFGISEVNPFFIWIKNSYHETLGFLPVLQVKNLKNSIHIIPAKKLDTAIFYKENSLTANDMLLIEQELLKEVGEINYQLTNTGWDLSDSLFSIFGWFPQYERKEMVKRNLNVHLTEVSYEEGKVLLKKFYEEDLEKKKNFQGIIQRDVDLFHNTFPENYRLILVEIEKEIIGVISFIDYSDRIYQMEFVGNATFNKFYPKILFLFFQALKKKGKKAVYPAFFEWCLTPFVAELIKQGKADISLFLKKSAQTRARNTKELNL